MSTEKIIDRVKKMLALGNNEGATEAERETALRMAYNLLAKHNLTMSDLPSDQIEAREKTCVTLSADKWARNVANSAAELFFCSYHYQRTNTSGKDHHFFVGKQSNVVTAQHVAEYLIRSIKKEATKRYQSPTSPYGRSFCVGAMRAIHTRVQAMVKDEVESAPGTALVLANLHASERIENDKWLVAQGTTVVEGKSRADNSLRAGAFYDGKDYGSKVSLNQQVGATRSTNLLR